MSGLSDNLIYIVVIEDRRRDVDIKLFSTMTKAMNYYFNYLKNKLGENLDDLKDPDIEDLQMKQENYYSGLCNHTVYSVEGDCIYIEEGYVDNIH